jgi:hypothetical protein
MSKPTQALPWAGLGVLSAPIVCIHTVQGHRWTSAALGEIKYLKEMWFTKNVLSRYTVIQDLACKFRFAKLL